MVNTINRKLFISIIELLYYYLKIFIGVSLINNIVLDSGVQQSESVIHISTLFKKDSLPM